MLCIWYFKFIADLMWNKEDENIWLNIIQSFFMILPIFAIGLVDFIILPLEIVAIIGYFSYKFVNKLTKGE